MKKLLLILLLFIAGESYSQTTVKQDEYGNYYSPIDTGGAVSPIKTGKFYTDSKGIKYPVYISSTGKLFIIMVSRKTGNPYKKYLKL